MHFYNDVRPILLEFGKTSELDKRSSLIKKKSLGDIELKFT